MAYVRKCSSTQTNTGVSKCPVRRGKIKGLILVQRGYELPSDLTTESLEIAEHADRPYRVYPLKTVEEYSPSGGEAQFSQTGYGSNNLNGYSPLQDTFTLNKRDLGLVANLVKAKNARLDVYLINDSNVIFGEQDSNGNFVGIPISSISIGGQQFSSSGQVANLTVTLNYKDIESHWKNESFREVGFDTISVMQGLLDVTFSPLGTGEYGYIYKITEKYGRLDLTRSFGQLIINNLAESIPDSFTASLITDQAILDSLIGEGYRVPAIDISNLEENYSETNIPQLANASILRTLGIVGITQEQDNTQRAVYAFLADENGSILMDENDNLLIGI